VEGLLLVLRLFGTNSLMTNSSLSQKLLEFSTLNTSGGADILNEDIIRTYGNSGVFLASVLCLFINKA